MSETETFEIMFDDLSEDAKKRFLAFMRFKDSSDGNYDIYPIATVEVESEVLEENAKEAKEEERKEEREERKKPEAVSFT